MSVAGHLGIETREYDRQILTFIPFYAEILDAAAGALAALDRPARTLVDLGTGTGALAARCVKRLPAVRVVGIDSDAAMLGLAKKRLGARLTPVVANFESAPMPPCDVLTASFSLHHVPAAEAKRAIFARAFAALRPGGMLVDADCLTNADLRLQARDHEEWRRHLAASHGRAGATKFLGAWAVEDTYFSLDLETALLRGAGFAVDVVWRRGAFAVVAAVKPRRRARR
ncbi:MAG TPA: class I SAM-dependent methyltransferase [Vicinamibacterales bacterium]|nr:class I SAM-dependent methyltransferase [Vicinamibacterales bacterium]